MVFACIFIIAIYSKNMKKTLLFTVLVLLAAVPATFGQVRFEIGANAPLAVGYISGSGGGSGDIVSTIEDAGIIPIPNIGLFLQANLGSVKLGVGVRAQSIILYSIAYPAAQIEFASGHFAIDASFGGYYFGYYAIGDIYGVETADILLPDLSVWFGFGKKNTFRIGGGAIGVLSSSLDLSALPFIAYAGIKVVLQ
jgi:hypothetical protein